MMLTLHCKPKGVLCVVQVRAVGSVIHHSTSKKYMGSSETKHWSGAQTIVNHGDGRGGKP